MCECQTVGDFFVCNNNQSNIFSHPLNAKNKFPNYLMEDSPCDQAQITFEYGEFYYTCSECQQSWYFECYPSTPTYPIFGIKTENEDVRLSPNKINSTKQFLTILAHEGFSENKCLHQGCNNYALKGIQICIHHFS